MAVVVDDSGTRAAMTRPPVAIGGVEGSGTRVVAEILRRAGLYMGADLNRSLDNLWFTLLLVRPRWLARVLDGDPAAIGPPLRLFRRAMAGERTRTPPDLVALAAAARDMAKHGHNRRGDGKGLWAWQRTRSLLGATGPDARARAWGWKEPHTCLLLDSIHRHLGRFRYVHVMRHGLDMAFSKTWQQAVTFGPLLGVDVADPPSPADRLRYWLAANEMAIDTAQRLFPDDLLVIDLDELCAEPETGVRALLQFAGIDAGGVDVAALARLPVRPASSNRSAPADRSGFAPSDLERLVRFGYRVGGPSVTSTRAFGPDRRPHTSVETPPLRLSVAMCTYDGAPFLEEQLASIEQQVRLPDEVVVSDDGSRDATFDMVERFANRVPFRVELQRNPERLGSAKNFEQTMRRCTGDVIVLSDHDDVWHPTRLEVTQEAFTATPDLGGLFSDAVLIDEQSRSLGPWLWDGLGFSPAMRAQFSNGGAISILSSVNVVTGATLALRADLRELVLPVPPGWVHDYWLALLIASVAELRMVPEPLVNYRLHDHQQIGVPGAQSLWYHVRRKSQLVRRMRKPVRPLVGTVAEQYREALEELTAWGGGPVDPRALRELHNKVRHFEARAEMERTASRWRLVATELRSGRYHRYSAGLTSAAKDLALTDR